VKFEKNRKDWTKEKNVSALAFLGFVMLQKQRHEQQQATTTMRGYKQQ